MIIMTAYADETRAVLRALGETGDAAIAWNSRLAFHGDGWSVLQSGMGKVRAASLCQRIIDTYAVDTFFEFGFAGGLVECLNIGDAVVITGVSEHDVPNRPEIRQEQEANRARLFQRSAPAIRGFTAALSENPALTFTTDSVICGDMDIYDREVRDRIATASGAVAVTWESAAIVEVCALNDVRYVGVRVISDLCVPEDSGRIPEARLVRIQEATTAYVEGLMRFQQTGKSS